VIDAAEPEIGLAFGFLVAVEKQERLAAIARRAERRSGCSPPGDIAKVP
jgi:hypothetical protein